MEHFIVSARKYRPMTFESVVGQENIGTTLKNAIQRKQLAHAYLFCGPRGVGKTTCARIFAKTINCQNLTPELEACGECESCRSFAEGRSYSIHELDAASNNSVDDIRVLTEQVRVPPQIGHYSVYIIDEVHMLSSSAFNAFLKTLEEPPAHAIFILATTEKHKILPTILSRCQIYDFNRISIPDMVKHLAKIATKEGVTAETEALNVIAQKADGAMRDALSIYDQAVAFCGNNLTYANVIENLNVLDYEYYFKLTGHVVNHHYADALLLFDEVLSKGFDAQHFIAGLSIHFRDLLVCKDIRTLSLLEVGDAVAKRYEAQAAQVSHAFLYEALQLTNACEMGYKASGNPRLHVELALLRLSNIGLEKKNDSAEVAEKDTPPPVIHPVRAPQPPPAPSPSLSPAPQPSPVPSPPPAPVPQDTRTFSLKEALAEEPESIVKEDEAQKRNNPFTQEQLTDTWAALVSSVADKPRLAAALQKSSPVLKEDNIVSFPVWNAVQKTWMEDNGIVLDFLRDRLQNDNIKLNITVDAGSARSTKPYTHDEKLRFLVERYPAVSQLKQIMKLDIR
ncbi:MAG: DNA polymerase III subunit gamma/tau [Prevotellaceae bacterium]|jgi:DNA polymerase-3 subunit gamma/tau|nr:DNA polymerase III subunit gamma/tau [Prevotellaceae bacterium]